jgi:hypothetical protein
VKPTPGRWGGSGKGGSGKGGSRTALTWSAITTVRPYWVALVGLLCSVLARCGSVSLPDTLG